MSASLTGSNDSQDFSLWTEPQGLHGTSSVCPAGPAPHCLPGLASHQVQSPGRVQAGRALGGSLLGQGLRDVSTLPGYIVKPVASIQP